MNLPSKSMGLMNDSLHPGRAGGGTVKKYLDGMNDRYREQMTSLGHTYEIISMISCRLFETFKKYFYLLRIRDIRWMIQLCSKAISGTG